MTLLHFYKRINLYSNNAKIDEIIGENNEDKKKSLIENLKLDDAIDFSSSGFVAQLFSIFNNIKYFCLKENNLT